MLFCDGEPGAEIYAAAADREQARRVFEVAKQQVLRQPVLNSSAKVFQKAITIEPMASSFKPFPLTPIPSTATTPTVSSSTSFTPSETANSSTFC
jgi:phage terminase large subunit-like protein